MRQARESAARHLLQTMHQVRIDGTRRLSHVMSLDHQVADKGVEMAAAAPVVDKTLQPDGKVEVTVQMALLGPLAQMVLPSRSSRWRVSDRSNRSMTGKMRRHRPNWKSI